MSGNGRRSIPRLPGLPIAGNIFEYARSPIGLLLRVRRELGDTAFFRMVPGQTIVEEPLVTLRPKTGIQMVVRRGTATEGRNDVGL